VGPAGERGKTGDHGQHGDTGEEGARGHDGPQGIRGVPGIQGKQGLRGRALTWTQALMMFLLIVLIGVVMAYAVERQQNRLEDAQADLARQQTEIEANTRKIAEQRYRSCVSGVEIINKFNMKNRMLIAVERRNTKDPLAKARIKAYQKALIDLPTPACQP
jgi:hypothetical protein